MSRSVLVIATIVAFTSEAAAQEARSAPISNVHYDVTFDAGLARLRSFRVTMSFDVTGRSDVLLSLPAWTPGAYEMNELARNVTAFDATQGGAAVRWEKEDPDTWRLHPGGAGRVTVRMDVLADTLDNSMAWTRPDFLMFNGTMAFLYPEGRGFDWPATVTVHTDPRWQVATDMTPHGAAAGRTFTETNYHDLVDAPFFVGPLEIDSAMVVGKWMRLITYPRGLVTGARRDRMWSALKAVTPPQAAVFGEVPWQVYSVMVIADSSYGGGSGLEHADSHVDIVTALGVDSPGLLSLYAHEIVHAWNVKRLRPAELRPYSYDREQPTPLLWVSEGITDYYGDLSLVRGGVVDSARFLATTEGKMNQVASLPATSLEDASLSTWLRPRNGTHYIYYDHGSLAGLMLDILIRDATNNARSLDNVMRDLYQSTYKRGRGFTNDQWWQAVDRVGGRSFADFRARYVDGREPLPYAATYPLAGIRVQIDSARQVRLGVFAGPDSGGMLVTQVQPGSAAADAGVQAGDYLLAIGDVIVTGPDFGPRFRERYGSAPDGTPVTIRVRRAGAELRLAGTIRSVAVVTHQLTSDPNANEKARRIRAGIFRGSTG